MTRPNRRGPWLPNEDEALLQLVHSQGPNNWVRISQHMQHRSPKQCRERYHQNLKPSLNHEPISSQEGELIEQMVNEIGKRWAEIARRLRNRSDNAVKNWWNGSMNRRKRNIIPHGPGMKGVGNRLQPIPAEKPLKTATGGTDRRRHHVNVEHQYEHDWAEPTSQASQRWRHMGLPAFRQNALPDSTTQVDHRHNSLSNSFPPLSAPVEHPSYGTSSGYGRYLPSLNQLRSSQPFPNPSQAQSLEQVVDHAPPPQQQVRNDSFASTSLRLNSQSLQEVALVSPVATEASHAPSIDRAPSLVSDNQSNCSISPKTVPSPRPDMPAPIDTDIQAWARQLSDRRDSASNILSHSKVQTKAYTDEGYVSAVPLSAALDSKSFLPQARHGPYRNESNDHFRSGQQVPAFNAAASFSVPAESATTRKATSSSKDTRMDLSNLLG